jgi:hypothetical protein
MQTLNSPTPPQKKCNHVCFTIDFINLTFIMLKKPTVNDCDTFLCYHQKKITVGACTTI